MKRQNTPNSGPSQRQLRVGEQLKHIVAETLNRGAFAHEDLREVALITVTEVQPSPDMRQATAYVVSLNDQNIEKVIKALNSESYIFQKEMGRQISMKFTPKIFFKADESFENSARINQLLSDIHIPEDDDTEEA